MHESNRWRRHGPAWLVKAGAPLLLIGAVVWMMYGHASGDTVFALSRFWIFGLALPGFLLWRIATPRRLNLVEDIAAGSVVGVSVLVLVYLGCSAFGLQKWAWLWIVPVLVAATTVPTLRRRWIRRVTQPLSATAAWLTVIACLLPLYSTSSRPPPTGPAGSTSPT